ncbi:MAG: carbamoyltransferase [Alphaproteobacteria bacterium]|nr:carbamoyltransferase [Alphaproteobacteria bacterium]
MLVLGIHMGHDSAVAVVNDGEIVSLIERERHTRVKHAAIAEITDIEIALADAGCTIDDIDVVSITATQNWPFVFYDKSEFFFEFAPDFAEKTKSVDMTVKNYSKFIEYSNDNQEFYKKRMLRFNDNSNDYNIFTKNRPINLNDPNFTYQASREFPSFPRFWDQGLSFHRLRSITTDETRQMIGPALNPLIFHVPIKVFLRGRAIPGVIIPHHLAHAANAFFQSDFESAAITTCDGGIRKEDFGYAGGLFCLGLGNRLITVCPNYLTSGNMYMRVGWYLKLDSGSGAPGKLMGLAPYGRPRFFDPDLVGNYLDAPELMIHEAPDRDASHSFLASAWTLLKRSSVKAHALEYKDLHPTVESKLSPFSVDLAASAQKLFEEQALLAATTLFEICIKLGHTQTNLCISGGAALNCPSNSRTWREGPFSNVFVPPSCDDSGLAIGSALFTTHTIFDRPRKPQGSKTSASAYLGRRHPPESLRAALRASASDLRITPVADAAADAADALANNAIVAWFEGRSEIGPRALGHRSILADPRHKENWERVNRIKKREAWRPFAPAVLEEHAARWFDDAPLPSPFMLFTARVVSRDLPAITHVDGSARIQTVDKQCGGFRSLLEAFHARTDVPIVMNTSFNGPGEPIVESPEDAIRFFKTSELDRLYIDGHRVERANDGAVSSEDSK